MTLFYKIFWGVWMIGWIVVTGVLAKENAKLREQLEKETK